MCYAGEVKQQELEAADHIVYSQEEESIECLYSGSGAAHSGHSFVPQLTWSR